MRAAIRALLVVALAECGGSGSKDTASRTTTTTVPTAAADRRLAAAAISRPTDLPGWVETARPGRGEEEIKQLATGIPGCEALVAGLRDGRVHLRSPKFEQNGVTVDADVDVYATAADMQAQLELYRAPGVTTCLQNLYAPVMQQRAPAGTTVTSVSVSPIAVEDVGDGGYGFRLTAELVEDGQPQTILSDLVGVGIGRVGASLTVTAADPADLASTEGRLLPIVAQRVRNRLTQHGPA